MTIWLGLRDLNSENEDIFASCVYQFFLFFNFVIYIEFHEYVLTLFLNFITYLNNKLRYISIFLIFSIFTYSI